MILQETRDVPGAWLLQGGIHLRTTLATLKTREELGGPPSFKIRGLVGFAVHSSLIAGSANADASRKPAGWLGPSAELECKPSTGTEVTRLFFSHRSLKLGLSLGLLWWIG